MDNSVFSVTPPSLYLNENGPSIMCLGFQEVEIKQISDIFDKLFPDNSITYFYDDKSINDGTLPWARAVIDMSDFVIVNVDTINQVETFLATVTDTQEDDNSPVVIWVSPETRNKSLIKLLVNYRRKALASIHDLQRILEQHL